ASAFAATTSNTNACAPGRESSARSPERGATSAAGEGLSAGSSVGELLTPRQRSRPPAVHPGGRPEGQLPRLRWLALARLSAVAGWQERLGEGGQGARKEASRRATRSLSRPSAAPSGRPASPP